MVRFEYERDFNHRTLAVDENGVETAFAYDTAGRLTQKTEARGTNDERITRYTYDADGNLETVTRKGVGPNPDAVTTMTYDGRGNLTQVQDPEGGIVQFTDHDRMGILSLNIPRHTQP